MTTLFLDKLPEKISTKTMLVQIFNQQFTYKALQNEWVTVADLVKAVKKHRLTEVIENEVDRQAIEQWLQNNGLIRNRGAHSQNDTQETKPEYPPNPKIVPLEKILLETDCPYMTPEPFRGKRNEPSYTLYTAKKIAEIKKIDLEEVISRTTENAKIFFGIK